MSYIHPSELSKLFLDILDIVIDFRDISNNYNLGVFSKLSTSIIPNYPLDNPTVRLFFCDLEDEIILTGTEHFRSPNDELIFR